MQFIINRKFLISSFYVIFIFFLSCSAEIQKYDYQSYKLTYLDTVTFSEVNLFKFIDNEDQIFYTISEKHKYGYSNPPFKNYSRIKGNEIYKLKFSKMNTKPFLTTRWRLDLNSYYMFNGDTLFIGDDPNYVDTLRYDVYESENISTIFIEEVD
jgi:hypothetical protein